MLHVFFLIAILSFLCAVFDLWVFVVCFMSCNQEKHFNDFMNENLKLMKLV